MLLPDESDGVNRSFASSDLWRCPILSDAGPGQCALPLRQASNSALYHLIHQSGWGYTTVGVSDIESSSDVLSIMDDATYHLEPR